MDDLKRRWARLEPHLTIVGPDDDRPRPAVLLFHGCGGLRGHLPRYAEEAAAAAKVQGVRRPIRGGFILRIFDPAVKRAHSDNHACYDDYCYYFFHNTFYKSQKTSTGDSLREESILVLKKKG